MKCLVQSHENFEICGVCLDLECELISRMVCPKCLMTNHKLHTKSIILLNDIIDSKLKDLDYLKIFPEIETLINIQREEKIKESYLNEIMQTLEFKSSQIYDNLHENFENILQKIKDGVKETTSNKNNKNTFVENQADFISRDDLLNKLGYCPNIFSNLNNILIILC
jgi:hypothetical protein